MDPSRGMLRKAHPTAVNRTPPPPRTRVPIQNHSHVNFLPPPSAHPPPRPGAPPRAPVHSGAQPPPPKAAINNQGNTVPAVARNRSVRFLAPPVPQAVMMEEPSDNPFAEVEPTLESDVAHDVRSNRVEWNSTTEALYSSAALTHFATAPNPLPLDGVNSSSSHSHSSESGEARRRFDIVADVGLLQAYDAHAYRPETDDKLHDIGRKAQRTGVDRRIEETLAMRGKGTILSARGVLNMAAVVLLFGALVMLFAGYPAYSYFTKPKASTFGATGLGGTNGTGQVPSIPAFRGLIDKDTPEAALSRTGFDGKSYQLVFSDEFEQDGRTFYPGEDPFWTASDLDYWQTENLEWYDPGQITTKDGHLELHLTKETNETSHNKGYLGGMLTSWNQFCFTGGYVEVSLSLPGDTTVGGLWPAAWTLSNLGRAGYGGSLDGTWPYVYDTCDVGTLKNQTNLDGSPNLPESVGDPGKNGSISYLPGQRLSACTCPGEDHPGPVRTDGSFKGRGAAEIDILEALINEDSGLPQISQSLQYAPFNPSYAYLDNSTDYVEFFDNSFDTKQNGYAGGSLQQVLSGVSDTDHTTYNSSTKLGTYGFEWQPSDWEGFGTGKVTFMQGGEQTWRISDSAMSANQQARVSDRPITGEPMYIILNLGMSPTFGAIDLENLQFPAVMRVDYVRVYQDNDHLNIGCDPPDYPTATYIKNHPELYHNSNITVLADLNQTFPKNRLIDQC